VCGGFPGDTVEEDLQQPRRLLVIFAVNTTSAASPPKLLDPVCQLQLTGGLIRFGPLALIGFLLMPLAS
jgi:hypothetical protein